MRLETRGTDMKLHQAVLHEGIDVHGCQSH